MRAQVTGRGGVTYPLWGNFTAPECTGKTGGVNLAPPPPPPVNPDPARRGRSGLRAAGPRASKCRVEWVILPFSEESSLFCFHLGIIQRLARPIIQPVLRLWLIVIPFPSADGVHELLQATCRPEA